MTAAIAALPALPIAHHQTIMALPVFAPAIVICLFLLVQYLRERRRASR